MRIEVVKIQFAEKAKPPRIEVFVSFREEKQFCAEGGTVNVFLDYKDYTVSEIKAKAVQAAKELLQKSANEWLKECRST